MEYPMYYTIKDIIREKVSTWKDIMEEHSLNCDTVNTLVFIKELCSSYNLGGEIVKETFDYWEEPFWYNLETEEIEGHE